MVENKESNIDDVDFDDDFRPSKKRKLLSKENTAMSEFECWRTNIYKMHKFLESNLSQAARALDRERLISSDLCNDIDTPRSGSSEREQINFLLSIMQRKLDPVSVTRLETIEKTWNAFNAIITKIEKKFKLMFDVTKHKSKLEAFIDYKESLCYQLQSSVLPLTNELWSARVITEDERKQVIDGNYHDKQKYMNRMIDEIGEQISQDPAVFEQVVDTFMTVEGLKTITKKLLKEPFLMAKKQIPEKHVTLNETSDKLFKDSNDLSIDEKPLYSLNKESHVNCSEAQPGKEETIKREDLEKFCHQVDIIVQTVNENEKWAVLKYMEPPEIEPGKPLTGKPIDLYEPNSIILGMFGGYKCAMIQTKMGGKCRLEVERALEMLPQAKALLAIGVAYAISAKLGDVLVSKVIYGIGNKKREADGSNTIRDETQLPVSPKLEHVFARGMESWYKEVGFKCSEEGRPSKVHIGTLISDRELINNKKYRDEIASKIPGVIGGEMEGVVLIEVRQHLAEGKSTPRALDIIIIKGVADFADGNKLKEWQYTAALAAANYVNYQLTSTKGNMFIDWDKRT